MFILTIFLNYIEHEIILTAINENGAKFTFATQMNRFEPIFRLSIVKQSKSKSKKIDFEQCIDRYFDIDGNFVFENFESDIDRLFKVRK